MFSTTPHTVCLLFVEYNNCAHKCHVLIEETDADEETLFMQKLEYLRKYAEIFLKMLNDMRRRLKELSPDAPAAQQYK